MLQQNIIQPAHEEDQPDAEDELESEEEKK